MAQQKEWTLEVDGMTCDHCARAIDEAIRRVPGVVESTTHFETRQARIIAASAVSGDALAGAIAERGYRVVGQTSRDRRAEGRAGDGEFDLAVIGGGSAGFAAAIRAADLGARVALVEGGALGGTCVNIGCVPSKTLIRAAEVLHRAGHHGFAGIRANPEIVSYQAVVAQKDELVAELQQAKYTDVLASYPSVTLMRGRARFRPDGSVEVDGQPLRARKVVLTTGARPWAPPIPGLDATPYLTSTEALSMKALPKSMVVVGGSAVGLELAQFFARMGTEITVLEALPRLAPAEDADVGDALAPYLREEGMQIHTGVRVERVSGEPGGYRVEFADARGTHTVQAEQLLVATGRRPNTQGMGLEEAGIRLGKKGEVVVDAHMETTRPGVYAAGDVAGDPMFVYVAAHAGSVAAENALEGNGREVDLRVVPRVTFTDPGVASVGLTEEQARSSGVAAIVSKLPMAHVPRAIAARDTRGFIKLVADAKTNLLVGAHVLAPEAGEMIQAAAMAIRFGIRVDEIAAMLHPYLTNAEGLKLACQTFTKDVAKLSCCAA
jgi:mercuric reductase